MSYIYNQPFEHVNMEALVAGINGDGVISGLTVTERGAGQNQSVDVASGVCYVNRVKYTENTTINVPLDAAHATLPRKDLIIYDTSLESPAKITGIASSEPIPPDIPSGDILLAVIERTAADNTVANTDINDGRIIAQIHNLLLSNATVITDDWTNSSNITDYDDTTYADVSVAVIDTDYEIVYDFGQNVFVGDYRCKNEYSDQNTTCTLKIQTSPNGSTWTTVKTYIASDPGGGNNDDRLVIGVKCRYIRLLARMTADIPQTWKIYDFQTIGIKT